MNCSVDGFGGLVGQDVRCLLFPFHMDVPTMKKLFLTLLPSV